MIRRRGGNGVGFQRSLRDGTKSNLNPAGAMARKFALAPTGGTITATPPLVRLKALCGPGDQGESVVMVRMPQVD
ncbi:MAG TPA: hypothetical protein VEL76_04165 [Gemmataceae bacterium]|nr:hypothetical protein [Gemmataceae bacterium]